MQIATLRSCLLFLSTVKKSLQITDATFAAWKSALHPIDDQLGRAAFAAVMRRTQIGNVEPAHVLEAASEIQNQINTSRSMGEPWISEASKYHGDIDHFDPTPEFRAWKYNESRKKYRSVNSQTGEIMLVQNPASWEYVRDEAGGRFMASKPQGTGQFIKRKEQKYGNVF